MEFAYIYILASKRNGTLYIGITTDIVNRIHEHKQQTLEGFTKKYKVNLLVWFSKVGSIEEAYLMERRLKKWKRRWKISLIEKYNPNWIDLSANWY